MLCEIKKNTYELDKTIFRHIKQVAYLYFRPKMITGNHKFRSNRIQSMSVNFEYE